MIKVFVLQPDANDGCSWYRIKNMAELAERGEAISLEFYDSNWKEEYLAAAIKECDVVYVRLHDLSYTLLDVLDPIRDKKGILVDVDDNFDDIDPLSDSYWYLGTREVQLPDGKYLWKDKTGKFDITKNKERKKKFHEVLSKADIVTTTTFTMKNYLSQWAKNVVVIPNSIQDFYFPPANPIKQPGIVKMVWSGGSSHYRDLWEILPVLKEVMNKHPNTQMHFVGQCFQGILKQLPSDRVFFHPWLHPHGHGYRMCLGGFDIALCPIMQTNFNEHKSSIKFYEYAGANICTLARNMTPYKEDIVDGQTGYLYNDNTELLSKLENMINDPIKRVSIANAGREWVMRNRSTSQITSEWLKILSVLAQKQ